MKDILISIGVFIVFEITSLLAQGKFYIKFNICDTVYAYAYSSFALLYLGYVVFVYFYSRKKMQYYKKIGY